MSIKEIRKQVDKNIMSLFEKANEEEKELLNIMANTINNLSEEKQELIDYLKEEINERKLTGNDEDYIKLDVYEEVLSKLVESDQIEKE